MIESMVELPVSLGEAIDKLTILDIKCEKINDNRKIEVLKEYKILFDKLNIFIETYKELYNFMKKVNYIIWEQMDILRDCNVYDDKYLNLCKECIETNDIRFRIKNKINLVSNSMLKEQKSYKIKRILLKVFCEEKYISFLLKPIKYFSYNYDEIIIQTETDINIIKDTFYYDNTIKYNSNIERLEFTKTYILENKNYSLFEIYEKLELTPGKLEIY
jgi:hypothetical protein